MTTGVEGHPQNTIPEIYKVQVPMASNVANAPALCYNKRRNHQVQIPIDDALIKLLDGRPKVYVMAYMKGGQFYIDKEVEKQAW